MARRASYIKQNLNNSDFQIIVDAGGFNSGRNDVARIKTEYILRSFQEMNFDVINIGLSDIDHGVQFLKDLQKKYQLPFVSANLVNFNDQKPIFKPYLIKKIKSAKAREKLTVGIMGLTDIKVFPTENPDEPWFKCLDPIETAREVVSELKNKVDLIICLGHMPEIEIKKIIKAVPGIDVMVCGSFTFSMDNAQEIDRTLYAGAISRGKYCEILNLVLDKSRAITGHTMTKTALDASIPDDPALLEIVKKSQEEMEEWRQKQRTEMIKKK